jgi:hypothetical protein
MKTTVDPFEVLLSGDIEGFADQLSVKFNPNHDAIGRFASGSGGSGMMAPDKDSGSGVAAGGGPVYSTMGRDGAIQVPREIMLELNIPDSQLEPLRSMVRETIDRPKRFGGRTWKDLPSDDLRNAIKDLKEKLRPWMRGNGNNYIRGRTKLSKANTFEEIIDAIDSMAAKPPKDPDQLALWRQVHKTI